MHTNLRRQKSPLSREGSLRSVYGRLRPFFQRSLDSLSQLIGAGSPSSVAVVAAEYFSRLLGSSALQQLAYGFEVAVAAADKTDVVQLAVLDGKVHLLGADALGRISVACHEFPSPRKIVTIGCFTDRC